MPNKYITVHKVPILDEHTLRDDEGKPLIRLTPERLQRIADKNNKRVRETGDMIPIVVGHTKGEPGDYVPEKEQPEIVGYAHNFTVSKFRKTARKAVHATFKFFRNKLGLIRKYPRRSIELWLGDGKIDPISLLGATTPARDLGLLQLSEGGRKRLIRVLKFEKREYPMNPEQLVNEVLEALKQTDVWKFLEQLKSEVDSEDEGDDVGMEGGPNEGELDDDPMLGQDEGEPAPGPEVNEDEEEGNAPVRYSAMGGSPSGTNTCTPGGGNQGHMRKKPKMPAGNKGRQQYSRRPVGRVRVSNTAPKDDREMRIQFSRMQKANAGLQTAFNDLRIKFQRSEREKDLIELEAEGYDIDRNEELDWLTGLPDNEYQYQLQRIRKRYQKAPIGPGLDLENGRSAARGPSDRNRDQAIQIANYAAQKGISYEQALGEFE